MKTYLYWEYTEPYPEHPTEMTVEDILKVYWEYFKKRMDAKFGPEYYLTTEECCIEDWAVVNWAWLKE